MKKWMTYAEESLVASPSVDFEGLPLLGCIMLMVQAHSAFNVESKERINLIKGTVCNSATRDLSIKIITKDVV